MHRPPSRHRGAASNTVSSAPSQHRGQFTKQGHGGADPGVLDRVWGQVGPPPWDLRGTIPTLPAASLCPSPCAFSPQTRVYCVFVSSLFIASQPPETECRVWSTQFLVLGKHHAEVHGMKKCTSRLWRYRSREGAPLRCSLWGGHSDVHPGGENEGGGKTRAGRVTATLFVITPNRRNPSVRPQRADKQIGIRSYCGIFLNKQKEHPATEMDSQTV